MCPSLANQLIKLTRINFGLITFLMQRKHIGSGGNKFIQITFNEKTKKGGHSAPVHSLNNNRHITSAQPGKIDHLGEGFKMYACKLNEQNDAFFQCPTNDKSSYQNAPIGKNFLGEMMKDISKKASLSKIYINHLI